MGECIILENFTYWMLEICQSKTATRIAVAGTNESHAYYMGYVIWMYNMRKCYIDHFSD